LILSHH